MSKVLHVLVYVFLGLAGAALWFELQLNEKRSELTDRNRMQEDYLVKIAKTIEKADPDKSAAFEIKKDASAVEAKLVDSPDMENVLSEYPAPLEQANLETFNWENSRQQLRTVYVLDENGKPLMDGNEPGEHLFCAEMSTGFDKVFDAVDHCVRENREAMERAQLFQEKINELKEIFGDEGNSIKRLRTLEFTFPKQRKDVSRKRQAVEEIADQELNKDDV